MSLRRTAAKCSFFAGSRTIQSELVDIRLPDLDAAQCDFLFAALQRLGCLAEGFVDGAEEPPPARFLSLACAAHQALLCEARFFMPEPAELVPHVSGEQALQVAVPRVHLQGNLAIDLLGDTIKSLGQCAISRIPPDSWVSRTRENLDKLTRPGPNNYHFVRAAHELGMPILEWPMQTFQVGYGSSSLLLKGSITQDTPAIGTQFARMKAQCNFLLAQAGFPIAEGGLVGKLESARRRAQTIGFPVAVKPADLDGGKAVSSDVRSLEELDQAYKTARAASANVIVEKHIAGNDYRLLLFRDRLLIAIERSAGGITGDGKRTVAVLLEDVNSHRQRGQTEELRLNKIAYDDEARLMLKRQGLTAESIPSDGQFVALRRAANFALGGNVRRVDDIVHPDNLDLARRAMRLLRLDLAGIDLIMPDITRPWHETGGAICEVNAQPFIGDPVSDDYHRAILTELVPDQGRIPIVLVIGKLEEDVLETISSQNPKLAIVTADGVQTGGRRTSMPGLSWAHACQSALYDPEVSAVLCMLDAAEQATYTSPTDRYSAAFLISEDALPKPATMLLQRARTVYVAHNVGQVEGYPHREIAPECLQTELMRELSETD